MNFDIKEKVKEYASLRVQAKLIKSRMDELGKEIKNTLTKNVTPDSKGSYYVQDNDFIYGNQAKKSIKLNEDKAKEFFTARNLLEEVVEVKTVINEDKVSKLLDNGTITQEELETLVDVKITYALDIKEVQKEEEPMEIKVDSSARPKRKLPSRR